MAITVEQLLHLVDTFDWDAWTERIRAAIEPHYRGIAIDEGERTVDRFDLEAFDPDDPFLQRFFTEYIGERITQIDDTTRDKIRAVLQASFESSAADSPQILAGRIRAAAGDAYAFSPARALTIARTETGFAVGHGAGLAYLQNGIEYVEISDGDGDEECAEADGQIWTVLRYLAEVLAHPNCVRSAAPVLPDSVGQE